MAQLPVYELHINEDDDSRIEYNSLVDHPAHEKNFMLFDKTKKRFAFDTEKRELMGVMLSANQNIYRNDPEIGEHYVRFTADACKRALKKFMKEKRNAHVNIMHSEDLIVKDGVYLFSVYIVDRAKGVLPPKAFESMNLQDGSVIATYQIDNEQVLKLIKEEKLRGFSIEGLFEQVPTNKVKQKQKKMSNKNKSLKEIVSSLFSKEAVELASVEADNGTVLMYEGELAEGTSVFVEVDGEQAQAPAGDYNIGEKVITVDENGVVTAMVDVTAQDSDNTSEEFKNEIAETITEVVAPLIERINSLEAKFKKQDLDVKGEKFRKKPNPNTGGSKSLDFPNIKL